MLEIGGHIGYVTQIFEKLVGKQGMVYVAEPFTDSRYFLKKNVLPSTCVLPMAISDTVGRAEFYTESFGGFTNSLVRCFTANSNISNSLSQKHNADIGKIEVVTTTVDALCKDLSISPSFIKIDVEGAELSVLKGAKKTLEFVDSLMVEVSRNHKEIFKILHEYGFRAYSKSGESLMSGNNNNENIFFIKSK